MVMGAIVFPIAVVLLAIAQFYFAVRFSMSTYLVLVVLSAFFCTLCVCLSAHFFVTPETRRGAVAFQVAIGLVVLWGGFSYFVMQSETFSAMIDEFHVVSELNSPRSPLKTEIRKGVEWIVPQNTSLNRSSMSAASAAVMAVLGALLVAPYLVSWTLLNLSVAARFRILISMTCVSWAIAGIAWSFGSALDAETTTEAAVPNSSTQHDEVEVPAALPINNDGLISSRWYRDSIPSFAIGILFAVPVYLSVPFAQLFLRTFADTNQLGKTWIITTVASLLVVVLMTMVAPRIFPNQTYSLATAGLALSLLSAWIILPTVSDTATTWIAAHVCGLTWMMAGFVFLGRPWTMSHEELLRHLAVLSD